MKRKHVYITIISLVSPLLLSGCFEKEKAVESTISFNHDIRPILNKSCTGCHGGVSKQANVSFIYREEALGRGHSGRLTIVPGDPDASELIARVESDDPNIRMPYKGAKLPDHEIQLLRDWIAQGANWQEHWAFIPPSPQTVPEVENKQVINNDIDAFLEANLAANGLSLMPKANKQTLLRRLSFDLIGLPPTPQEIDDFLADNSTNAYEKQVDRLLASPRYGERWAAMWMDLSRYADSHGYTRDEERDSWPYKQWVIEALNANQPYDQFMIEQLGGDLMPNRSLKNILATGFHRQTPTNSEGGTDDEEFRMVAVMDRNATTWSVLNAMTMNCVQCHSHPYDPIEHHEYYASLGFFNTSKDADYREYDPLYKYAKKDDEKQLAFELQEQLTKIREHEAKQAVELSKQTEQSSPWQQLTIESALGDEYRGLAAFVKKMEDSNAKLVEEGKPPSKYHLTLIKVGNARLKELADNNQKVRAFETKNGEYFDAGKYELRLYYHFISAAAQQEKSISAIRLNAIPQNPEKARHTPEPHFQADDVKFYLVKPDGSKVQLAIKTHMSNSTEVMDNQLSALSKLSGLNNKEDKGLEAGKGVGWFAHRLYLPRWSVAVLAEPLTLKPGEKIEVEVEQMQKGIRVDSLQTRLHRVRIETTNFDGWSQYANSDTRTANIDEYGKLKKQLKAIDGYLMPVMLEQDNWDKRAIAKFDRGNMTNKVGDLLAPNTPAIFPEFNQQQNRLGLAQWFFKPEQPLTARVAVNRLWHRLFGIGLVETLEDFGGAGSLPNHPELLDWLALKFQNDFKWDTKAILKLMVMSHAYQQDATVQAERYELDPLNKWFSRGPRQRLSAEMVRDQALVASNLIVNKIGGVPVMPPQPEGIWGHKGRWLHWWEDATDENRYRRAIYTFVKRAFMYPSFLTFDMETREISHQRRLPTNTPLQALVTLNDPVYHEAAQALGKIMMNQAKTSDDKQAIRFGFKRVVSRLPKEKEVQSLTFALQKVSEQIQLDGVSGDDAQASTWTAMGSILLNLDDALTR
ncbi:PSD1 and planctomycete cytochrome C domain-containing protein [Thalassotalea agariperforans]